MVQSYYCEWEVQHGISQEEPIGKTEALAPDSGKNQFPDCTCPLALPTQNTCVFHSMWAIWEQAFMGQFMSDVIAILKYFI